MNRELAMKVANAVLYEGYMLYPYRPSAIKNRQPGASAFCIRPRIMRSPPEPSARRCTRNFW